MNRIERAIDVFLDALNSGTLAKGTCTACAVGNLVAHGLNAKIEVSEEGFDFLQFNCEKPNHEWAKLFVTPPNSDQTIKLYNLKLKDVKDNIEATEFTWEELAAIENAFETNTFLNCREYPQMEKAVIRADQIKGLKAVIDVMLTFEEELPKEKYTEIFEKKAELIPLK